MTNSNPGGPGGKRQKINTNKARGKTSHKAAKKKGGCCFWVEGTKAVWAGKFRLARRYFRLGVKSQPAFWAVVVSGIFAGLAS